jgi:transcriptional regulator with XRE-family HTH domain
MSTQSAEQIPEVTGFPELTRLGKRIELFRIERGLSKQHLARTAGTSRQQLWRVMTGKSELTSSLCHRLADVLQVDPRSLRDGALELSLAAAARDVSPSGEGSVEGQEPFDMATYVADTPRLLRTLATLPAGDAGARLKREFLNCVEDIAREAEVRLPSTFFELRGRVINGEL